VLAIPGVIKQLNQFEHAQAEGSHPASVATATVFCFEALSRLMTGLFILLRVDPLLFSLWTNSPAPDAHKSEILEEKLIDHFTASYSKYKKYIPTENQKPSMAERLLRLLAALATHNGCRQAILKRMENILFAVSNDARQNEAVQKSAAKLLETLLESSGSCSFPLVCLRHSHCCLDAVAILKEKQALKIIESIEAKGKLFDKIKEKLK